MSLLDNLPHLCEIKRRTRSKAVGGIGVPVDTLVSVRTNVRCWEQQASASETMKFQKRGITVSKKIYFSEDPQIGENYVIVMTNRYGAAIPVGSQQPLDVKSSPEPDSSAGFDILWRVMCDYERGSP